MKAAPFTFHKAVNRRDALDMLATLPNAKLIAGGQSLVAMLNLRLASIDHLIDINAITDLVGMEVHDGAVRIGAMTRQRAILENGALQAQAPVIAGALRFVGHRHTRNRGTIGGSLAHMDPAAELMNIATLLDAVIHVDGVRGTRDIAIADYPVSFLTPDLEPDEMMTAVTLQLPPPRHGWSFHEVAQRHGDFAIVAVGVTVNVSAEGSISHLRVVLSGVDLAPRRLTEVERALMGGAGDEAAITAAAESASRGDAMSDPMASGDYRKHLAKVLTRRAVREALARAREGALQ